MTTKNGYGHFIIEIRDQRLPGGRLSITSRTGSAPEFRRRDAAVRAMLDGGYLDLVERLRSRKQPLRLEDVTRAARDGDKGFAALRATANGAGAPILTLGDATGRMLQQVRATRKDGTVEQYEIVMKMLVARFGSDTAIGDVSSEQLAAWIHGPQASKGGAIWSPARQKLAAALVGRLFNVEIRLEEERSDRSGAPARLRRNPVRNVELSPVEQTRVEFLRPPEWRTLIERSRGQPHAAFLGVSCLAGLRMSEARHLRVGIDVELGDRPVIRIQPRDGEHRWSPKGWPRTKRSVRDIPLDTCPELVELVEEHIRLGFAAERYFFHAAGFDRPASTSFVTDAWVAPAYRAAGIRYGRTKDALTHHSLRHTFFSWGVQEDVSLAKLEKLGGVSVKVILRTYGHLQPTDLSRSMGTIAAKARET